MLTVRNSTIRKKPRRMPRTWCTQALLATAAVASAGCHEDMYNQPRYEPLERSEFFADGRTSRPLVPGTVQFGAKPADDVMFTGRNGGELATELPVELSEALLNRGRERFNIYCSVCHSRIGDGNGMIVQRGYRQPPTFHSDRLRGVPVGHFFDVMTNGFGAMPSYSLQVPAEDRWAIAAYIRALQLSQFATGAEVPADVRTLIDAPPEAPPTGHDPPSSEAANSESSAADT
jgi:mono/diheme cytochrome c family protein